MPALEAHQRPPKTPRPRPKRLPKKPMEGEVAPTLLATARGEATDGKQAVEVAIRGHTTGKMTKKGIPFRGEIIPVEGKREALARLADPISETEEARRRILLGKRPTVHRDGLRISLGGGKRIILVHRKDGKK